MLLDGRLLVNWYHESFPHSTIFKNFVPDLISSRLPDKAQANKNTTTSIPIESAPACSHVISVSLHHQRQGTLIYIQANKNMTTSLRRVISLLHPRHPRFLSTPPLPKAVYNRNKLTPNKDTTTVLAKGISSLLSQHSLQVSIVFV